MAAQRALMDGVEWPKASLKHSGAAEEWDEVNERYQLPVPGTKTRRVEYIEV
jgi:hypothetical protein